MNVQVQLSQADEALSKVSGLHGSLPEKLGELTKLVQESSAGAWGLAPAPVPPSVAINAIKGMLSGLGLHGASLITVLRAVAESEAPAEPDSATAFNLAKLRSAGTEDSLLAAEGGAVSDAGFGALLGVSRTSIHNYRKQGKVMALPRGERNWLYPVWQVQEGSLLPGLAEVLAELRGRTYSAQGTALFFMTPAGALDEQRPLDLLRRGKVDEVKRFARTYGHF